MVYEPRDLVPFPSSQRFIDAAVFPLCQVRNATYASGGEMAKPLTAHDLVLKLNVRSAIAGLSMTAAVLVCETLALYSLNLPATYKFNAGTTLSFDVLLMFAMLQDLWCYLAALLGCCALQPSFFLFISSIPDIDFWCASTRSFCVSCLLIWRWCCALCDA